MKAYIAVSYSKKHSLRNTLDCISNTLQEFNIEPFIFSNQYTFDASDEKQMMQQAMNDIDQCNFFIAEVSDKAIGIGVEAGYAKAKNKPVLYVRQKDTAHSTTVSGISDYSMVYENLDDLNQQLTGNIKKILFDMQRG